MKMEFFFIFIFSLIKTIKLAKIEILGENSLETKYDNLDYLNAYRISHQKMRYKSNGDSAPNHDLSIPFDNDDFFSYWQSAKEQDDSFLNNIEIFFSQTITIDRMIYRAPSLPRLKGIGYPIELKIYYKLRNQDGSFKPGDSDYLLFDDIVSEKTENRVLFIFDEELRCDQIKLEWVEIDYSDSNNRAAYASEIKFLFPENELINKLIFDVYDKNDYSCYSINSEYNNINIIEEIEEELKEYFQFSEKIEDFISRIKKIIRGELTFEPKREFTTDQMAEKNIINQHGNINEYSRTILKMNRGSTNRQPTGIYAFSNEIINFFVEANDNDFLPSVVFSQFAGNFTNWLTSPIKLKRGKNYLKVKEFDTSNLIIKVKSGGPIYIENIYTSEVQSQHIKIYIEGGTIFPFFRLNDDEQAFKRFLNQYTLNYNNFTDDYYNIVELFSDSVIITVNATVANDLYNTQGESPQENLLNWDRVVRKLYIFDGIQFEENQPYYDERNQYIILHIRYATPYEKNIGAYACDTHIGIFFLNSFCNVLVSYEEIGSTQAHEIGHMIDVTPREYAERTNVVLEEYAVQVLYKDLYIRKKYETIYEDIAPDNIENSLRHCQSSNKSECNGFFNNAGNYVFPQYVWWNIESFYPGYWGKLNNLYRFNITLVKGLDRNEAMVFLTNLIVGFDTAYYFERMGLAMDTKVFKSEEISDFYKMNMDNAIKEGKITNKTIYKQFWYADNDQYNYTLNGGKGCYKNKNKKDYDLEIIDMTRENTGIYISLPHYYDNMDHLGFEIIENEVVIGFTKKNYFVDKNEYDDDYNPRYKIRAYDRVLDYIESDYKECC